MRAVVQRVKRASVVVDGAIIGQIDRGLLIFVAFEADDTEKDMDYILDKTIHLRIFEDDNDKMNLSLLDVGGELLTVSQFTLYGDCRKGRRPGFSAGAPVEQARAQYNRFVEKVKACDVTHTAFGEFQADMQVDLVNDGPVTLLLDSDKNF